MFKKDCKFITGATTTNGFPSQNLPEFAFIGVSNVGKSSLINAIVNRKSLAITSQSPGRTRQINFFLLDSLLYIVDLPGYGYAKISKTQRFDWGKLVEKYFVTRKNLKVIFILVDARRGFKDRDIALMNFLETNSIQHQIILTKSDKKGTTDLDISIMKRSCMEYNFCHHEIIITSSKKKTGINEVRNIIKNAISK